MLKNSTLAFAFLPLPIRSPNPKSCPEIQRDPDRRSTGVRPCDIPHLHEVARSAFPCCRRPSRWAKTRRPAIWAPHRHSFFTAFLSLRAPLFFRYKIRETAPFAAQVCVPAIFPVYTKSREAHFLAAAGRRGGRPKFGRRSDNLFSD